MMRAIANAYDPDSRIGWIKEHRAGRLHPIVGMGQPVKPADPKRGAYSRYEAWRDLLMMACHGSSVWMNKGHKTELKTGQLAGGYSYLASRWNWTMKQVRNFLARLIGDDMMEASEPVSLSRSSPEALPKQGKQGANMVQTLTVCNYSIYQKGADAVEDGEGQAEGNREASQGQDSKEEGKKRFYPQETSSLSDLSPDEPGDVITMRPMAKVAAAAALASMMAVTPLAAEQTQLDLAPEVQQAAEVPTKKTITRSEAAALAVAVWNTMAEGAGLSRVRVLNESRKSQLMLRIKDAGGFQVWSEAINSIPKSKFLLGDNQQGWRADFDFACQSKSFAKLLEGSYHHAGGGRAKSDPYTDRYGNVGL